MRGVRRENLLLIILPPLNAFNACVTSSTGVRARTAKNSQFITTLSDFEMLLLQMTAGFMCKLAFVLHIDDNTHDQHVQMPSVVRSSSESVLGHRNCHWPLNEYI